MQTLTFKKNSFNLLMKPKFELIESNIFNDFNKYNTNIIFLESNNLTNLLKLKIEPENKLFHYQIFELCKEIFLSTSLQDFHQYKYIISNDYVFGKIILMI